MLSSCQQKVQYDSTGPGYWLLCIDYKTDYMQVPYIWFYSEVTGQSFANTNAYGQILTTGGWEDIKVHWDYSEYMTISDDNGNVLIEGSIMKGGNGSKHISFNIEKDNVYKMYDGRGMNFIFSRSKDARIPD